MCILFIIAHQTQYALLLFPNMVLFYIQVFIPLTELPREGIMKISTEFCKLVKTTQTFNIQQTTHTNI